MSGSPAAEEKERSAVNRLPGRAIVMAVGIVILIVVPAYLYFFSAAVEPDGFRGVKWGSTPQAAPGLTLVSEEGPLKFYERADDPRKVEDAAVRKILYVFFKDRFHTGLAYFDSAENFEKLKAACTRRYGTPIQMEGNPQKLFWNFENVGILLTFDEASGSGRMAQSFKPIQTEMELSS